MIYSYKCKNFYSIGKEVEVKFSVNKGVPQSDTYVSESDRRVSLVEAVVGPNASGKTNVIKALAFIRYLIAGVGDIDSDTDIPIVCFANSKSPTEVSVKFSTDERFFIYGFTLNRKRILSETIKEESKSAQRITTKTLFTRTWHDKEKKYTYTDKVFGIPANFQPRRNASIVSSVHLFDDSDTLAKRIVRYWRGSVVLNVWERGILDDNHLHSEHLTRDAIRFFYNYPELKDAASDILQKIDVGFHDFEREELKLEKKVSYGIKHKYSNNDIFSIPLSYESSGTKRAILMLKYIIQALENESGGIAAIDELDAYLHPDIVEALVKLFMSPETNPHASQLLFSSHSHQLLAEFDKQQIILVEKNDKGETEVWRLDDVTGVRADENYYTKYIAGAYGAKPKVS